MGSNEGIDIRAIPDFGALADQDIREKPLQGEQLLHTLPTAPPRRELLALSDLSGNPMPLRHAVTHAGYAVETEGRFTATEVGRAGHVVLCGDLHDRASGFPSLVRQLESIREAGISVMTLYGNHEIAALAAASDAPMGVEQGWFSPAMQILFHLNGNSLLGTLEEVRAEYEKTKGKVVISEAELQWLHERKFDEEPMFDVQEHLVAWRRILHDTASVYARLFAAMQPLWRSDDMLCIHAGVNSDLLEKLHATGEDAFNEVWKGALKDPTKVYRMAFGTPRIHESGDGVSCTGTDYPPESDLVWRRCLSVLYQGEPQWMPHFLDEACVTQLKNMGINAILRGHDPSPTRTQSVITYKDISIINLDTEAHKHTKGYTRITRGGKVFAYPPGA